MVRMEVVKNNNVKILKKVLNNNLGPNLKGAFHQLEGLQKFLVETFDLDTIFQQQNILRPHQLKMHISL